MASPTAFPFPPTAMWPGRAALWRPAHRPPGMPFAAPRAPAPTGYWLVARTVGTLVLGGGEIRVCTGGRDAIKISLIAASVSGVVVPPAGEDGGGGALGGTWVFAATAWFTDAATARRSYLNFCFRLERPEDGPRLREAWGALAAAAERARSLSPVVEVLPPPAAAPSAPVPAPSAPAPASLVTVQALSEGGGGSSGGGWRRWRRCGTRRPSWWWRWDRQRRARRHGRRRADAANCAS